MLLLLILPEFQGMERQCVQFVAKNTHTVAAVWVPILAPSALGLGPHVPSSAWWEKNSKSYLQDYPEG